MCKSKLHNTLKEYLDIYYFNVAKVTNTVPSRQRQINIPTKQNTLKQKT